MNIPKDLLYTKTHEWVQVKGEVAYVGVTDFAQEHLGDIVFVEAPEMDKAIQAGEELCVVESVKTVATVYSPLSGKVIETNSALEDAPELINQDPYTAFVGAVQISNLEELKSLLTPEAYEVICNEEA